MATLEYLTLRELRNTPGALWKKLRSAATVALTSGGVPKALVIGLEGGDLEETMRALTRVRAQLALSRIRQRAAETGFDRLSQREIQAELAAVRAKRPR